MSSTITAARLARLAREGRAPDLAAARAALASGSLWDVDTQGRGADCVLCGESADDALAEIALHEEPELAAAHPGGPAEWARARGWTAAAVHAIEDVA